MDELLKLLSENSKFTPHELSLILGEPQDYIEKQIEEYEATEADGADPTYWRQGLRVEAL